MAGGLSGPRWGRRRGYGSFSGYDPADEAIAARLPAFCDGRTRPERYTHYLPLLHRVVPALHRRQELDLLMQATRDSDAGVRSTVIRNGRAALADAPFALAVGALTDTDIHVHVAAVQELRWLKDKRAVAHLTPLLDDQAVLHHDVRNGVRTTHRMCDEAVEALEYLVNSVYLLPGDKTQTDYDDLVQRWRDWSKANVQKFDEALYEEPELKKVDK